MSMTVDALISLRSQVISGFVEGGITEEAYRADLDALAVELDRLLTPDGRGTLQQRAAKVVVEILADSHARLVAEPPARLAQSSSGVAATASACAARTPIDMRPSAEKRRRSRRSNPTRSEWPARSLRPFAAERVRNTDGTDWQQGCAGPRSSSRRPFQRFLMSSGLTMIALLGRSSSGACRVRAAVSQSSAARRASTTASPGWNTARG